MQHTLLFYHSCCWSARARKPHTSWQTATRQPAYSRNGGHESTHKSRRIRSAKRALQMHMQSHQVGATNPHSLQLLQDSLPTHRGHTRGYERTRRRAHLPSWEPASARGEHTSTPSSRATKGLRSAGAHKRVSSCLFTLPQGGPKSCEASQGSAMVVEGLRMWCIVLAKGTLQRPSTARSLQHVRQRSCSALARKGCIASQVAAHITGRAHGQPHIAATRSIGCLPCDSMGALALRQRSRTKERTLRAAK